MNLDIKDTSKQERSRSNSPKNEASKSVNPKQGIDLSSIKVEECAELGELRELLADQFMDYIKNNNEKLISVSICDHDSQFVYFDKYAELVLDCKKQELERKSLYDLMIPQSKMLLNATPFQKPIFSFTVYSETAKKKFYKHINKVSKGKRKANLENYSSNTELDIFYK